MPVIDILVPHKIISFFLLCTSLASILCSACSNLSEEQTKKVNQALNDSLTSSTETWGVDMDIIEDGLKKVNVKGSYAASFDTEKVNETRIKGPVHINVFDSTGTVKTQVDCNHAIYRAESSEFELFGNVKVNTHDDRHLDSEYLKWKQADNSISTPHFVIIITRTDSIAGSGFNGTTDLNQYTIKEPTGRVIVN